MADAEDVVQEQETTEVANFLDLRPRVEEEEDLDTEPQAPLPLSVAEPSKEDTAEAVEAEAAAEETVSKNVLETVAESLSPAASQESNDALLAQIQELKERQARSEGELGAITALDKIIGKKEEPAAEASLLEEFDNPAVAKMLADARESEDPQAELRLITMLSDKLAEKKIESRVGPLEQKLEKQAFDAAQQADVAHRMSETEVAAQILEQLGGTAKLLAQELREKKEKSILSESWLAVPGITLDHGSMVKHALGTAALYDGVAAAQAAPGNDTPEVSASPPATTTVIRATGQRPRASNKARELTQSQTETDPGENVIARLRAARRTGGGLLDSL